MEAQLEQFIKEKKLPDFISKNKELLSFDKIDKIFPKIGLVNSSKEIVFDNTNYSNILSIELLRIISQTFNDFSYKITSENKKIEKLNEIAILTKLLDQQIYPDYEKCIFNENGKISLKLYDDILTVENDVIFKSGQSIFKIYNNIYKTLLDGKFKEQLPKLDSFIEFKNFSSNNLPNSKFKIVFSSNGKDGLWDIATMSMRGISSCQSWDGQYKNNLIGSIIDPFTAIIYITSGNKINNLGTKMVRRSIVRFVNEIGKNKPVIIVDKIYPIFDQNIIDQFISFILEKTDNKFSVKYAPEYCKQVNNFYIPFNPSHKKLSSLTTSYRDTKIPFRFEVNEISIFDLNIKLRKTKFINLLKNSAYKYLTSVQGKDLKLKFKNKALQTEIDKIYNLPDFSFIVRDFYTEVAKATINSFNYKDILTSEEYGKKLYLFYINNKNKIFTDTKSIATQSINKYFNLKLKNSTVEKILKSTQNHINNSVKAELKKMISKSFKQSKISN